MANPNELVSLMRTCDHSRTCFHFNRKSASLNRFRSKIVREREREINLEAKAKRENLRPFNTPSLTLSLHLQTLTRSLSLTVSFMVITLPDEPVPGVLHKPCKLWLMRLSSASTLSSSEFLQSRADTC